jgi:hypothetical protein
MNEQELIEKKADEMLCEMIKENPVKMMTFFVSIMGREAVKTNADTLSLSQEMDIEGARYKVQVEITTEKISKR